MTDIQEWIDQGKTLADHATQGPWEADGCEVTQHWSRPEPWQTIVGTEVSCMGYCYGGSAKGVERDEDAEFIADARTRLPQALDALQAVLDLHHDNGDGLCNECSDEFLANDPRPTVASHPCPTVQAIQTVLGTNR